MRVELGLLFEHETVSMSANDIHVNDVTDYG